TKPNFYVARYSKANKYRPTFPSKDLILTSASRAVDISQPRPARSQKASSKGPRTKKRRQMDKDEVHIKKKRSMKKTMGYGFSKSRAEDPGERRKLKPGTKNDHYLRANYITKSLKAGSLHANIKRTLSDGECTRETRAAQEAITRATEQVDLMCAVMYEVVALDIDGILAKKYEKSTATVGHPLETSLSSASSSTASSHPLAPG
ncbi:hypothetical protein BGW39_004630, partial [Mortierella sp. 14UC]